MSPLAKLHTQLINLQDHIQALRALAAAGGDAGIVQLTGNQIDRLLAPVDDAVCECVEILEDAADATAKKAPLAPLMPIEVTYGTDPTPSPGDSGPLSDAHGIVAGGREHAG